MIYIFWSCKDQEEARKIICELLNLHLIACASFFSQVQSLYFWKGEIEESSEIKVILKTEKRLFEPVRAFIKNHCSYEIPEIVSVDIAQIEPSYLSWLSSSLIS